MDHFIGLARSGRLDEAFHGLRALDPDVIPALCAAHGSEADPRVRALIVAAVWQHRDPSALGLLATALQDESPEVWKQAIDGLVTLASPEARRVLLSAAADEPDPERRAWLVEAAGQVAPRSER